jgi:hypothetical protein
LASRQPFFYASIPLLLKAGIVRLGYNKIPGFNKTQAVWVFATMPTVLRVSGMRVVIYPNDHRPAHVHMIGAGLEASFNLHCPSGPMELRENFGFSDKALAQIASELTINVELLCKKWEEVHGHY